MIRIRFENSLETPCYIQVDPWAGLYQLRKGEVIEIEVALGGDCPSVEIDECGETKIITLPDCDEYFVIQNGKRYHWTDFTTNVPGKSTQRIHRPATATEKERHLQAREQIAGELPEIKRRGREALERVRREGTPLSQLVTALKIEREKQGLSLADINARTGIDRAALSRLENNEDANPTLNTLQRYAAAIGKEMIVVLTDAVVKQ